MQTNVSYTSHIVHNSGIVRCGRNGGIGPALVRGGWRGEVGGNGGGGDALPDTTQTSVVFSYLFAACFAFVVISEGGRAGGWGGVWYGGRRGGRRSLVRLREAADAGRGRLAGGGMWGGLGAMVSLICER